MKRLIDVLFLISFAVFLWSCEDDLGPGRPSQVALDYPLKPGTQWTYSHTYTWTGLGGYHMRYVGVYVWTLVLADTGVIPRRYTFFAHEVDQIYAPGSSGADSLEGQIQRDEEFNAYPGKDSLTIEWGSRGGSYLFPGALERIPLVLWTNEYRATENGYVAIFERGKGLVSCTWPRKGNQLGFSEESLSLRSVVIPP